MPESEYGRLSRRDFLKLASAGAGIFAVGASGVCLAAEPPGRDPADLPRLNPGFRIQSISPEAIDLYTHTGDGRTRFHRFTGLEADLFREIQKEKTIGEIFDALARKRGLSRAQCRAQMARSLKEFEAARLIYYGDKMRVKIVEVGHVR